jgi:hypothetical protein
MAQIINKLKIFSFYGRKRFYNKASEKQFNIIFFQARARHRSADLSKFKDFLKKGNQFLKLEQ